MYLIHDLSESSFVTITFTYGISGITLAPKSVISIVRSTQCDIQNASESEEQL